MRNDNFLNTEEDKHFKERNRKKRQKDGRAKALLRFNSLPRPDFEK